MAVGYKKPGVTVSQRQLDDVLADTKMALEAYWYQTKCINMFEKEGIPVVFTGHDRQRTALLGEERLRLELAKVARFMTVDNKGKKVDGIPPMWLVRSILANPVGILKPLAGLCYAPVLDQNGHWLTRVGYDEVSHLYRCASESYHSQDEAITLDLAKAEEGLAAARDFLWNDLLEGFKFQSDADKCNALAFIILPFVIRYIGTVTPMLMIEAPQNNSGKSTLGQFPAIASMGRPTSPITPEPDSGQAELGKLITSRLLESPPIVMMDNINNKLKSSKICSMVTEGIHADRLLGGNNMADIEIRSIWIITANNPAMSDEFARRTIRAKLVKSADGRKFSREDPKVWLLENRVKVVNAIITVVNCWLLAGCPEGSVVMASFQRFSRVMSGIMALAGFPDFMKGYREIQRGYDNVESDLIALCHQWTKKVGNTEATLTELMMMVDRMNLFSDQLSAGTDKSRLCQLSHILGKHMERDIDGFEISHQFNSHTKTKRYLLTDSRPDSRAKKPPVSPIQLVTSPVAGPEQTD